MLNTEPPPGAGLTLMVPFSVGQVWNAQLVLDGSYNQDVCDPYHAISFNRSKWQGIAQLNNSLRLSTQPDIRLELNGLYVSSPLQGIYDLSSVWKIDAGLKWTFAHDQAELKLQGNDLFNSLRPDGSIDYKGQRLNLHMNQMSRNLTITFTYKFNGYKEKKHKEVDTSRFGY